MSDSEVDNSHLLAQNQIDFLYKSESARLHAILMRLLGASCIELVDDIVQDTFSKAFVLWGRGERPDNPQAWLVQVAKNLALDALRNHQVKQKHANDLPLNLQSNWTLAGNVEQIRESLPAEDAQLEILLWLSTCELEQTYLLPILLRMVCGLSLSDTAKALFISPANLKKRLQRGQQQLKNHQFSSIEFSDEMLNIEPVHKCLYLLFNAGMRSDNVGDHSHIMAVEALNLCRSLLKSQPSFKIQSQSLLCLMLFYLGRQHSRVSPDGELIPLHKQDRSLWRNRYSLEAIKLLSQTLTDITSVSNSSNANQPESAMYNDYLYEALIANEHLRATSFEQTDYHQIKRFYHAWYQYSESPMVLLNLCISMAQLREFDEALSLLEELAVHKQLKNTYHVVASLAYVYASAGKHERAAQNFSKAVQHGMPEQESKVLKQHLDDSL